MKLPIRLKTIMSGASRARSLLMGMLFVGATSLALVYHLLAFSGKAPSQILRVGYDAVMLVGYSGLWFMLSDLVGRRRPSPARSFWSTALTAGGVVIVSHLVLLIGASAMDPSLSLGFDLETGLPLVLTTVFKTNILGLLYGGFGVILMLRMRDLVLVKRTRSSLRNWRLLVTIMVASTLSTIGMTPGQDLNEVQTIIMIIAVVFMVVSSFRLSWIVFLSFKEKVAAIGLSLLLLAVLILGIGILGDSIITSQPGSYTYVQSFSYPLSMFSGLAAIFGILYCTTAFLSLLFHLPTTGEFEARAGERAAMQSMTRLVGQVFDPERLHAAIAASPVEAGVAQSAWLALADPKSGSLTPQVVAASCRATEDINDQVEIGAFYDEVRRSINPLIFQEAMVDRRIKAGAADGIASLVVVPLVGRDRHLGALFASKDVARGFERDEIETMNILAAQASLAIENANLLEQQVEKERLERELAIAREVQQRLLPQHVPAMEGLSIFASSVPAQEVGGDYYDFVELEGDRLGIIIADVSGKGTSAAFYMAEMQGIFQSVSRLAPSPVDFLHHANIAISQSLERNVFVSVIYGVVDIKKQEFVLARAGHCPAAAVGIGGKARFLRSQGIGLGLDRGELFRRSLVETTVHLQPGDVFVLYTDGVVESRSPNGEEYGYDRVLEILENHREADACDIHNALIDDLNSFVTEGADYGDDMTLVVLKWHGLGNTELDAQSRIAQTDQQA